MSTPNKTEQPPCIASQSLFGDNRQIFIQHQGEIYTLRITNRGKLILTK